MPPFVRMQKIMQHADRLKVFEAANNILRSFGIRVDKSSQKVRSYLITNLQALST